jgi:two-component system LytT family response regulator
MTRRLLIADDEPFARERLRMLLQDRPEWEIVAQCADGPSALDAIVTLRPDLVLLDIRMPGLTGIEVAEALEQLGVAGAAPVIVFVTAFEDHALRAFDVAAIDYLLKPVDQERLDRALARAGSHLAEPRLDAIRKVLGVADQPAEFARRILCRDARGGLYFVKVDQVDWIEARGNYVSLHTGGDSHLVRSTMQDFERRLDPAHFLRIHRSVIVALDRIRRMEPAGRGEYEVTLLTGTRVVSSRAHSERLRQLVHGQASQF